MNCIHCGQPLAPNASTCGHCGRSVARYAPPEGFVQDTQSHRYYRSEAVGAGDAVRWVTWFDPGTGAYEQISYPVEPQQAQPAPAEEPVAAVAAVPEPEPQPQLVQPAAQIPEGFVLDPGSGRYYAATPGRDTATGADGTWYTWFTPSTGEYAQSFQPSVPVRQTPPAQRPQMPGKPALSGDKPAQGGGKKKLNPLVVVLPVVALLIGVGIAFFGAGGFAWFSQSDVQEVPEGMQIVTLNGAELPQFQPIGEGSAATPGDETVELSLDKATYAPGEMIQVTVRGLTQQMQDDDAFVAIYVKGDGYEAYMEYGYPSPDSDTIILTAPTASGDYEVRLYRQDYDYTDDSFVTLASFSVESSFTMVRLNMELMDLIGASNARIKEINGDACWGSYLMYGDGMVADYLEMPVTYPVTFWLTGGVYEEVMEMWAKESNGGHPVEGRNIWKDEYTVNIIEASGAGLDSVFNRQGPITLEDMNASFTLGSEISFLPVEEQVDWTFEFDIWMCDYVEGEFTISATFYEQGGQQVLLHVMIWR